MPWMPRITIGSEYAKVPYTKRVEIPYPASERCETCPLAHKETKVTYDSVVTSIQCKVPGELNENGIYHGEDPLPAMCPLIYKY